VDVDLVEAASAETGGDNSNAARSVVPRKFCVQVGARCFACYLPDPEHVQQRAPWVPGERNEALTFLSASMINAAHASESGSVSVSASFASAFIPFLLDTFTSQDQVISRSKHKCLGLLIELLDPFY
jgi:hypothetical protein